MSAHGIIDGFTFAIILLNICIAIVEANIVKAATVNYDGVYLNSIEIRHSRFTLWLTISLITIGSFKNRNFNFTFLQIHEKT